MRHLHAQHLRVATRGTTREINRQIALNLVRTHQPISRADLARLMGTRRGAVSLLVNELIRDGAVFEGATGEAKRGRKPTFLYIDSRKRCVVAVDIRPTRTFVMVTDLVGRQLASVTSFPTERDPKRFVAGLVKRVKALLAEHKDLGSCQGVGVVVPGVVGIRNRSRAPGAESGLAQPPSARSDRGRARRAGPDRKLRQGLRAGAALGGRRRQGAQQLRLHHRVGRPRRRDRAGRRGRARAAQRRGGIRPRPVEYRRSPVRMRRDRMLGSVRLEPRHALAVLRPRSARTAGSRRRRVADGRRSHRPRPRRRRQGARRLVVDGDGISASAWARSSMRSIRRTSTSAAKSPRRGISSKPRCARGWRSAR